MASRFKWKTSYRFYRGGFRVARALFGIFYRFDIKGREKIPQGAAMVCSNHSSVIDPIFVAFAFGADYFLHFIAKIELFRTPVISMFVTKLGAISVDRGMADITTIKNSLSYLKAGEKVAIFPEGARVIGDEAIAAKTGAVKIAERAAVPIIPAYVPRRKRLFSKIHLVIGDPYYIEKAESKRSAEDYMQLSDELMEKIEGLNPLRSAAGEDNT